MRSSTWSRRIGICSSTGCGTASGIRHAALRQLEARRPHRFGGLATGFGQFSGETTLSVILTTTTWAASRAGKQGMHRPQVCPYCPAQAEETECNVLWECPRYAAKRNALMLHL